ncbi:helix-turn-helix domain-containing protein [Aurantimonas sp. A2-1-M11]|uniref:helix-turn-helix domain-containing protein n=1 Tax=Aurantimonas sp. A2-1-M11 TaxID=3113712 RepID=UPI002F94298F
MTELMQMDADTIGGRIQRGRESLGITTAELAARLGVKIETMRGWERDRAEPRANRLIMLAGLLGVSPAWLIGGYGEVPDAVDLDETGMAARLDNLRARRDVLDREITRLEAAMSGTST